MKLRYSILAFFACILIAFSCKDNSSSPDSDPPENPNIASKDIGPDGGEVASKDGKLILTIPAGALGNTETITIEQISPDELGSEFDEIVDVFGVENAWELGPDGLQFNQPITVSIQSDQTPIQENDSLGITAEFLFTSSNGTVEALDSLRVEADAENNTATVSGQMSHFSLLVDSEEDLFEPQKVSNGIFYSVTGVPDMLEVGSNFEADIIIATSREGSLDGITSLIPPIRYIDGSDAPLVATFEGAPEVDIPLDENVPAQAADRYRGKFGYTCTEDGPGLFFAEMQTNVEINLKQGPITLDGIAFYARPVECIGNMDTLSVEIEGNGTVTSSPGDIDCPDGKCEHGYDRGTDVTLTATPAQGFVFEGWSGGIKEGDDCGGTDPCTVTMDGNRKITATFVPEDASSSNLLLGLYILSEEYGITLPEALSLLSDPFLLGGNSTGKHAKFTQQAQQDEVQFGDLTGTFPVAIAGAEGYVVIDLLDGEVLLDETDINNTGDLFGVVGATQEPRGTGSAAMLMGFGGSDYVLHRNTTGGSFNNTNPIVFNGETAFDAFPAGGDPVSDVVSFVQPFSGVGFFVYDDAQDIYVPAEVEFDASLFENRELVSAYVHDDVLSDDPVPQPRGNVLVLTREAESGVYLAKWDGSNPVRAIDNIGFDARKIRCIDDGSGNLVCVASIFGHDRLGLLTWDGENQPTLTDFAEVGDGPVGIDLRLLPDGNIAVVSTGFNDNTVTETVVAPNGIVQSSSTRPVLEGCQSPGHAIFIQDVESLKIVYTCYNSSNYGIEESGF